MDISHPSKKLYEDDSEAERKSLDVAIELVKQQITLASVLVGLALTFSNNYKNAPTEAILKLSILCLVLSFVAGIMAISIISSVIARNKRDITKHRTVRPLGVLQGIAFVSGVLLMALSVLLTV